MKKVLAISMMCIFALAFSCVRATDTSPGAQKFSIEKVSLQASPAIVAVFENVEIATPHSATAFVMQKKTLKQNEINLVKEIHRPPAWQSYTDGAIFKNRKLSQPDLSYLCKRLPGKSFINVSNETKLTDRLIPYSRDRSVV